MRHSRGPSPFSLAPPISIKPRNKFQAGNLDWHTRQSSNTSIARLKKIFFAPRDRYKRNLLKQTHGLELKFDSLVYVCQRQKSGLKVFFNAVGRDIFNQSHFKMRYSKPQKLTELNDKTRFLIYVLHGTPSRTV